MTTLRVEIECGKTTCASEPGKFCRFVETTHFGQRWHCGLFRESTPKGLQGKMLSEDENGWLVRLPECLAIEEKSDQVEPESWGAY